MSKIVSDLRVRFKYTLKDLIYFRFSGKKNFIILKHQNIIYISFEIF